MHCFIGVESELQQINESCTMEPIDNNQFEVKPTSKRKINSHCPNVYLNPALDLLANEDPMCNTAMEITPNKRRKCANRSNIAAFENSALDLGISKSAINEFLTRELENVKKNIRNYDNPTKLPPKPNVVAINEANYSSSDDLRELENVTKNIPNYDNPTIPPKPNMVAIKANFSSDDPLYANLSDITHFSDQVPPLNCIENVSSVHPAEEINEISVSNCNLPNTEFGTNDIELDSGIPDLEQNSANTLDKIDLSAINHSNIEASITNNIVVNNNSNVSLSFIDRLALDSPCTSNQSLYLDDDLNESNIMEIKTITIITKKKLVSSKKNTNPFLDPNINVNLNDAVENPFIDTNISKPELEYNVQATDRPNNTQLCPVNDIVPRRLFSGDTNSTISTVNESSSCGNNEYENIDHYRAESPIYENIGEDTLDTNFNKQSKILGYDVSQFSAIDILNLNKSSQTNTSNESTDSKKDFKKQILKASNKLSKKVFKTLKKTFKGEKIDNNVSLNPYEVPRKVPKSKPVVKESGIENPALNLDNSDDIDIEEIDDDEHQYETIKTIRNTRLNMNVTPLKERVNENLDVSQNRTGTPGKKVRFDSTLNREKIITGDSFDCDIQSPGFDAKLDRYHDELENCINERKFIQQNM